MGVAILPKLAAMVSSTTIFSTVCTLPPIRSTRSVNGTKVISATSLVITILLKKQSTTMTAENLRIPPAFSRRKCPSMAKIPSDWKPATMIIRQNKSAIVW